MTRRMAAATALISAMVASGQGASEPADVADMNDYLWRHRPLLVFAPAADDSVVAAQRSALAGHAADLLERDMILIEIIGDQVSIDGRHASAMTSSDLRDRYGVRDDASVVLLVGKDGGVKMSQTSALSPLDLFQTIDAMPMRQREMGRTEK